MPSEKKGEKRGTDLLGEAGRLVDDAMDLGVRAAGLAGRVAHKAVDRAERIAREIAE